MREFFILHSRISLAFAGLTAFPLFANVEKEAAAKPNILFIAVDDLKPWVGAYGDPHAKTPGMDKLAREGIVFQNSYCQQAISGPTRASLMTGMHPDKTRVWDLKTDFRQVNPNVVTLPQYFRSRGYETAAMGKIYHMGSTGPGHDAPSWSVPYRNPKSKTYALPDSQNPNGKGKATECADVPDDTYHDGKMTGIAIQLLDSLSMNKKPFFLAVGFLKPHLPFVAPKKYWDLYDRDEFEVAPFQKKALNSPDIAYHKSGETKSYSDIPQFDSYSEKESDHLPVARQKELIHGYYAAISYVDAQILQLLNELERLGIRKNTIVVLWGDHGWHLGDHGLWNKHTNFEQATHGLLMMSVPGKKKGIKPVTLCEFTDIFPTLCELADLPVPEYLEGISLVPAITNPDAELREYAMSQYPRAHMGYSIRTKRFRYTEWISDNFRTYMPYDQKFVIAREMYDYQKDPLETESVLEKSEYKKDREKMEQLFRECMQSEFKKCSEYSKIADYRDLKMDVPDWAVPAIVPGNKQVTLNWLSSDNIITGYCIQYRTSNSTEKWTEVTNISQNLTSYTVNGLTNLKSYEFRLGTKNAEDTITWSTIMHGRPRGKQHPSGLHAGGQINAIARAGDGNMVAGGDVSGFHRSLDGGETWFQSSRGMIQAPGSKTVSSLTYHGASGSLYGACSAAFYKSMDNGATWTLCYSGEDISLESNSNDYPRRVGKLIAVDPVNVNMVYLGTLKGLIKSEDGGVQWAHLALAGKIITSIVLDKGFLYASVEKEGVYRCAPDGSVTLLNGAGSSTDPEEILALGGNLYVAANTDGIIRLENPSGSSADKAWTNLNIDSKTARWSAIDGFIDGNNTVIVAGNAKPEQLPNGRCTTIMKCLNAQAESGFRWVNLSSAETTTVKITLASGNGETWWRVDPAKGEGVGKNWCKDKRLDGPVFAIDQILIDPDNTNKIHAAGQMGIWRTLDGGITWEPACIGLGSAVHNCIAVDPNNPGYVYVGDTDNGIWISHDYAESVAYITRPPSGAKPTISDIAIDPSNSIVYAISSDGLWSYDPVKRIWSQPKGINGKVLEEMNGGKVPRGVGILHISGSSVIMAVIEGSGIWRLAEGSDWSKAFIGPVVSPVTKKWRAPVLSQQGSSVAYFCDLKSGVWRSQDAGTTWIQIWKKVMGANSTGNIAVTSNPTQLFVAAEEGVFRLDHADTGNPAGSKDNSITITNLGSLKGVLLAAQGGTLWASGRASPSGTKNVVLWKSIDGETFTPFPDGYYEGAAGFATGLAVEPGFQYTSAGSFGTIVSER